MEEKSVQQKKKSLAGSGRRRFRFSIQSINPVSAAVVHIDHVNFFFLGVGWSLLRSISLLTIHMYVGVCM